MRKEFSASIEKISKLNEKIIFLTGDLGFMALENIRDAIGDRFVNMGVSEQNMVSVAASLASEGLIPICYSIAPFVVFRPAEQIRLDVCLHNMNVKIVGNGGGFGYGIMGATHHAIEDIAILSCFQNMTCFIPFCNEDVDSVLQEMMNRTGPAYLRLGYGSKPQNINIPTYDAIRKLSSGPALTIAAMGPIALNALKALEMSNLTSDLFVFSEIPIPELSIEFKESIMRTKKLLIIEEHVGRGGLGEMLALMLMKNNLNCKIIHNHAANYHQGLYGSQAYHQKISKLDSESIIDAIKELTNA